MSTGPSPLRRPAPDEYVPYYQRYIDRVPEGDVVATLATQIDETLRLLGSVAREREAFRPTEDAWSIREVVGHLVDTERVLAYRALSMARGDPAALPSMDQETWAAVGNAGDRPLSDLVDELRTVRHATVALFAGLDPVAAGRQGTAGGNGFTVRSFAWIIAGHELHHRALLREKYGVGA